MRIVNGVLALLFTYFAFVQFNDPDPVLWVMVYGFTAMICLLAVLKRLKMHFLIVGTLVFILLAITKVEGVIEWLQAGEQSEIFGEMSPDRSYVEDTREFFGLTMAFAVVLFNWLVFRKTKTHAST